MKNEEPHFNSEPMEEKGSFWADWRRKAAVTIGATIIGLGAFGGTQSVSEQPHNPNDEEFPNSPLPGMPHAAGTEQPVLLGPDTSLPDGVYVLIQEPAAK